MNARTILRELELVEQVARGGFATVWHARHVHTQHPLAIKFLRRERLHQVELLHAEARAISRLHHRHIATIYDIGTLPEPVHAPEHRHHIPASTPYIVMEWADQSTSLTHSARWSPAHVVTVLEQTLGALAHIHAHGLLHLDIKPSNVLLTRHESLAHAEVRLVDMGLWPLHEHHGQQRHGTPGYIAPEPQVTRASDLYSVGVMALSLLGHHIPTHHDADALSDLIEATNVPWRAWIKRCTSLRPQDRFSSAAHAREALLSCACTPPAVLPLLPTTPARQDREALRDLSTLVEVKAMPLPSSRHRKPMPPSQQANEQALRSTVPPWPEDGWSLPHAPRPIRRLARIGGSLFAQRALRFVGRVEERDRLWQCLRDAERHQRANLAIIEGEAGIGRRALATWTGQRCVELLGGHHVEVESHPDRGKLEGYKDILQALHEERDVIPADLLARREALEHALTTYATGGKILFEPWQALDLCRESILAIARHGRLVLHIRGITALDAPRELLSSLHGDPLPVPHGVLVIATHVQEGAIGDAFDDALRLEPGPLKSHEVATLVDQSIGLDPLIIDELARRSRGNPGYVHRTLLAWLQRDWLVPGARGLTLRSWIEPWLGEETLTLKARLTTLLERQSEEARRGLAVMWLLEQCRALTHETFILALERSLDALSLPLPTELLQAISQEHDEVRTRFEPSSSIRLNNDIQHVLEELLDQELSARHLVETVLLEVSQIAASRQTMFRLWQARMAIRLGEIQEALRVLRRSLITGLDPDAATQCLEIVERLEYTPHDRGVVHRELRLLRARALFSLGDHDADEVLDASGPPPPDAPLDLRFAYHEMKLIALLGRGLFQEAEALRPTLLAMLEETPRVELLARIHSALTRLGIHTKHYEDAIAHASQSSQLCEAIDEPLIELSARNMYAIALQESDEHDRARTQLQRCHTLAQTLGSARFQVIALNTLGDLEMRLGQWRDAQHWLRLGLEVGRQRYPLAAYLHGNLAWAALHDDQVNTAREHIDEALSRLADEPSIVKAFLLELKQYALAIQDEPHAWDACMDSLDRLLDQIEAAHEEGVEGAKQSATLWESRRDTARATRARRLQERLLAAF